ncbi:MAG: hypothetical protein RLZZ623_1661 [Actinomycetota bacterium]|jgi:hypothetical protein
MAPPPDRPAIERLLDLTLYAPVGAALAVRDQLPKCIRQGRQAFENRVQLARFIGQIAVQQGQKEVAKRLQAQRVARESTGLGDAGPTDAGPADAQLAAAGSSAPREVVIAPVRASENGPVLSAQQLPIGGYESLAAIHVVERLGSLTPAELSAIQHFEMAHRGRRTVLAKIAQLQGR